jgi:hypothetical protein
MITRRTKNTPVAGLDPATHVFFPQSIEKKTWMPGTSPGKGTLEISAV